MDRTDYSSDFEVVETADDIDLEAAKIEARITASKKRLKANSYLFGGLGFIALLISSFGGDYIFVVAKYRILGFGVAAYLVVALGALYFINATKVSTLEQERDVLLARKRILARHQASYDPQVKPDDSNYFARLVDINISNLGAYYGLIKIHANNSFRVSLGSGVVGYLLILTGLIIGFAATANPTISYIASGSGILTEFISGVFFYLYNKTIRQMKDYHDSLLSVQNVLLSFKIIGDSTDGSDRSAMMAEMLRYLVGTPRPQQENPK